MVLNATYKCSDRGLILPIVNESTWSDGGRALLYLAGLFYTFLGIAIAADVFMCAIERITSTTRKVRISPTPEAIGDDVSDVVLFKEVRVWNPTVANLTLMALGSSAPEILLSIIEIVGNGFKAGDLGPGTIVGSAAFNLLIITAVCIVSIPDNEAKRIEQTMVFATTAGFSVFAYIWLLIILKGPSPNEVEVWEGLLTLVFFPLLVIAAYLADKKICLKFRKRRGSKPEQDGEKGVDNPLLHLYDLGPDVAIHANDLHDIERQVALEFPGLSNEELARLVAWRIREAQPRDRLWYRIQACRTMGSSRKKEAYWNPAARTNLNLSQSYSTLPGVPTRRLIEFDTRLYAVNMDDRRVQLKIVRRGRNTRQCLFRIVTINGSAAKNTHFLPKTETMRFEPGEVSKKISIELIEGAQWKPLDVFYVHLELEEEETKTELGRNNVAEIQYLDGVDKVGGTVEFVKNHATVAESAGYVRLGVIRRNAFGGRLAVTYHTEDGTAEGGSDYVSEELGELHFENNEVEKYIDIAIIDDMEEEKDETFTLSLTGISTGGAELGIRSSAVVTILCDDGVRKYFKDMDNLVPDMLAKLTPGKQTWKEQIIKSISVNAGDLEDATFGDCVAHMLAFPWKVVFAFVPPPYFLGGWLTFFIALALIGLITAIVGDLAGIFGCLVGLEDSITAITFVALGTSLPDTFASRLAATQDKSADNAIGNVTGSNSVNVFLGLGLPWFVAAIYWAGKGEPFKVSSGSLGFSVTLYTIFSTLAIGLLFARRYLAFFGNTELGGTKWPKWGTALIMIFFWFLYILLSTLQAYGYIDSF